jgi:hypothetical protein
MKKIIQISLVLLGAICINACKKKTPTSTTTIGSDFFVEGKGLRKIWGIESPVTGLGSFAIANLTATPEGKIHTVFAYTRGGVNGGLNDNFKYRKLVDATTGDTMQMPAGPDVGISGYEQENGAIMLLPYTQLLAYNDPNQTGLIGEASWLPVKNIGSYNRKIYKNNQTLSYNTYNNVFTNKMETYCTIKTASIDSSFSFMPNSAIIGASLDINESGTPFMFVATDSKIEVIDPFTNTVKTSVSSSLFNPTYNYNQTYNGINMISKRSEDNSKIIGMIVDETHKTISTFIYTIASNTIELKLNKALNPVLYILNFATTSLDENGNVYYVSNNNRTQINKITPSGDAIYKTGFLKGNGVMLCLKSVGAKLFAAVGTNGNNQFTDTRGKGNLLICEVE